MDEGPAEDGTGEEATGGDELPELAETLAEDDTG
jgi:hypothetical protein